MSRTRPLLALASAAAVAACASAGKRLEQGIEAETEGSFYAASIRYVEALEKDRELTEARDRLLEAGDSAVRIGLEEVHADLRAGEDVSAAEGFHSIDRLIARARSVGVRLPAPEDYADRRRGAFDGAILALTEEADDARRYGRWSSGRGALIRIRRDFEPSAEQRRASETAEAELLLDWAHDEAAEGRPRRAYDLAGEAMGVGASLPADLFDAAEELRGRALADGTHLVAVLPVSSASAVRDVMESDLDRMLDDLLELDHWREPPLFVVVADPVEVRRTVRRWAPPGTPLRPGRILDEVGADFGVLVELVDLTVVERDLKRTVHEGRTADGRPATWTEERGVLSLSAEARVTVLDATGRRVADGRARESEDGPFERGIYRGDPRNLELSRGERRLFDPVTLRRQRADLEEGLVAELAARVADQVFSRVLAQIP